MLRIAHSAERMAKNKNHPLVDASGDCTTALKMEVNASLHLDYHCQNQRHTMDVKTFR
jgi:hypothetical protein